MGQYFPKPYGSSGGIIKIELDLYNYGTKAYLKGVTGVDRSNLAAISVIARVDKIAQITSR